MLIITVRRNENIVAPRSPGRGSSLGHREGIIPASQPASKADLKELQAALCSGGSGPERRTLGAPRQRLVFGDNILGLKRSVEAVLGIIRCHRIIHVHHSEENHAALCL